MYLVDEQDYIALTLYLVHKALYSALELSTELSTGHKCGKVQKVYLLVGKVEGNVPGVDALCDALSDSGLANAGLTDKAGVVLGPSGEYLDDSCYFLVTADDVVELTVSGFLGEVGTIASQELQLLLLFLLASAEDAAESSLSAGLLLIGRLLWRGRLVAAESLLAAGLLITAVVHAEHIAYEIRHYTGAAHFKGISVQHTHHLV